MVITALDGLVLAVAGFILGSIVGWIFKPTHKQALDDAKRELKNANDHIYLLESKLPKHDKKTGRFV